MSQKDKATLAERVTRAAEDALTEQGYASAIDVLLGIRWLYPGADKEWQQGRIEYLDDVIQTNPSRLSEAMRLFRDWATRKGLVASETDYVARTPQRQTLRFSKSGDAALEKLFRTHWISGDLPEKKRERLVEKANRAPDLVAIQPVNREWKCHRCGGTGGILVMEKPGPACLHCVGLGDLEFLPAGDALLTRRVKAKSARHAVVVRFSKNRGRYERQGLLVEPKVLQQVQRDLEANASSRVPRATPPGRRPSR
ncbi:hypothetical protein [Reyranella sp.]|uniref:hypothetical protein n=1 Tax=Reyranella sp. TaxID=1929291 RepID=UPI003D13D0BC